MSFLVDAPVTLRFNAGNMSAFVYPFREVVPFWGCCFCCCFFFRGEKRKRCSEIVAANLGTYKRGQELKACKNGNGKYKSAKRSF